MEAGKRRIRTQARPVRWGTGATVLGIVFTIARGVSGDDESAIEPRGRHATRAELRHGGRVLFRTSESHPVLTHGASSTVELAPSHVSPAAPPPPRILDVPATYAGTIPCADCPGIRVTLTLFEDGKFRRLDVYLEGGDDGDDLPRLDAGEWRLEEGRRVVLTSEGRPAGALEVISSEELRFLGAEDRPIETELPFELHRLSDVDPLEGNHAADAPLIGTSWELHELPGAPTPAGASRPPHFLLHAVGNRVSGSGGCNRLTGSFERSGRTIRFVRLATTQKACEAPAMERERAFLDALGRATELDIEKETLTLTGPDGAVARFVRYLE